MAKAKKEKKPPQPFWQELVETYFTFCREKFGENPAFDGSSPRDLTGIIEALKARAIKAGAEWTQTVAEERLKKFLECAYQDKWMRENFLLYILNRQKDKIFFRSGKVSNPAQNAYQSQLNEARNAFRPISEQ